MILLIIGVLIPILLALAFLYEFPILYVCGESMYPTFKEGTILLCKRIYNAEGIKKDDILVFNRKHITEKGKTKKYAVVKRVYDVFTIEGETFLYFLGDNLGESYDSRSYGYVSEKYLKAKVIKTLKY